MAMIHHSELFNSMFDEKTFSSWAEFEEQFESLKMFRVRVRAHSHNNLSRLLWLHGHNNRSLLILQS